MKNRCHHCAPVVALTLLMPLWPVAARAQDFATVTGKERIPRGGVSPLSASYKSYKSWSLFLVTNQSWLTQELASSSPQGRARVNGDWVVDLYERSHAFGRVIGDDHLAVWFWKESKVLSDDSAAKNVDVERAIAYCTKLKLKPSEGPYLLFTTTYPDENTPPAAFSVIELGPDAERISRLLTRLGDELVTEGIIRGGSFAQPTSTDRFWSAWFDATQSALVNLGLNFRLSIRTPTLSLESGRR